MVLPMCCYVCGVVDLVLCTCYCIDAASCVLLHVCCYMYAVVKMLYVVGYMII